MTVTRSGTRGAFTGHVIRQRKPCREHFELTLRIESFPDAQPGQFVQILCATPPSEALDDVERAAPRAIVQPANDAGILLRRPFSIGDLRRRGTRCDIDIMGRVVGLGTAWLDARMPGDLINVIGPLGKAFRHPEPGQHALLIAGGVGLPPIFWLGKVLAGSGMRIRAIYGAQSRDLIPMTLTDSPDSIGRFSRCAAEFGAVGIDTFITTDDGSYGLRGRVTDAFAIALEQGHAPVDRVYACGPEPMLRAVSVMCAERRIPCELAMERVMACGMGTCQSCVVKVADSNADDGWRYALCCTEGPVFEAARILWPE